MEERLPAIPDVLKRESMFLSEAPKFLETDLADGTNVAPDTEYIHRPSMRGTYIDLKEHRPAVLWQDKCMRLLAEFRAFREVGRPVGVVVEQDRIPGSDRMDHPAH